MSKKADDLQNRFPTRMWIVAACVGGVCVACGAEAPDDSVESIGEVDQAAVKKVYNIDIRRSLVVTEKPILDRFSFQRVMEQLVDESGVPGLTATALFQQWWDTQNPGPGLGAGAHCDDQVDAQGTVLNGYPYLCRPAPSEGSQAACDPFAPNSPCAYIPIALFNRFDQAPENGAHCGEHRIVYAKASGVADSSNRNVVIFEANMANPLPAQGLKGCKKIVETWAKLTDVANIETRADKLEAFYFDGVGLTQPPVVSLANFGDNPNGRGQIRTNQLVNTDTGWSLREFKLLRECAGGNCTALRFVPVTNKTNAFGGLFDPASTHPLADDFRAYFPTQVASLAATDINKISMEVPDMFNSGQSQSSGTFAAEMRYLDQLGSGPSDLRTAIQAELTSLGSTLSVDEIVRRAQTTSCAGCHRLSAQADLGGGLVWPDSQPRFVHVTERQTEIVDGVERFVISEGLLNVFLPNRKLILDDFMNNKPRPPGGKPTLPIGGSADHG